MRTIKILLLCQSSLRTAMPYFCLCRNNTIHYFKAHFSLQSASCLMLLTTSGFSPPAIQSVLLANTYKRGSPGHASCSFKIKNTRHEVFFPTCTEHQNQSKKESFFSYMYISCKWAPNARRIDSYINKTQKGIHPWSSNVWGEKAWIYWI